MPPDPGPIACCPAPACQNRARDAASKTLDGHPLGEPTILLAAAAGLASFLSPCMLPVIPAFFTQLAGTPFGREEIGQRDVFFGIASFVAGFSLVFAVLDVLLGAVVREVAAETMVWLSRLAGAATLELHLTGLLRLSIWSGCPPPAGSRSSGGTRHGPGAPRSCLVLS